MVNCYFGARLTCDDFDMIDFRPEFEFFKGLIIRLEF